MRTQDKFYSQISPLFTNSLKALAVLFLVMACSSNDEEAPDERLMEKELYDSAQFRLKAGNYESAIFSLEALERRFPFGRYAEQAQAELIYAYYMNYNFEQAISAADRFISLHPRHPHIDYAYYLKGLAGFRDDVNFFSRFIEDNASMKDVSQAQSSFEDLSEFLDRFPNSVHAPHAKQRLIFLRNLLAKHEIYVSNFYIDRGAYIAAAARARYVIEHLPNTPQTPYALSNLITCYENLGYEDLKQETFTILEMNYPDFAEMEDYERKRSWLNRLSLGLLGTDEAPAPPISN